MTQETIFVLKINKDTQTISLFQPVGSEGKGRAVAIDYKASRLKRGLLVAIKAMLDVLSKEI